MALVRAETRLGVNWRSAEHSARTAVAAIASFVVARALGLPEAYWATITALIVMQSTLGAAAAISAQRFAGTALGAAMGALLATYFGSSIVAFGVAVFVAGLLCSFLRLERSAYRYASITLAIVALVARSTAPWVIAVHRFVEVSVGIVLGLALTALWPESLLLPPASERRP